MVEVFPNPDSVMGAAADRFIAAAAKATSDRGRFLVSLSGGSTPEGLYRRLASQPYRGQVAWDSVEVFWGDERCVPPEDAASNYRMARRALLDEVGVPQSHIHRVRGEADPSAAAQEYELTLRAQFETPRGPPRAGAGFDLVLLGLGPDGHTASLFPGSAALEERERWALPVQGPIPPAARVTLTPPVLRTAREMIFLVTGAEKAPALGRALGKTAGFSEQPSRVIRPADGTVRWLVDSAAAAVLPADAESA